MVNLTEKQEEGASFVEGALLILAGAGSGKTRTLIERAARLARTRFGGHLMLTFSRKAAGEMRERIVQALGEDEHLIESVEISTFHAFCYKLHRDWFNRINPEWQRPPTIMDDKDLLGLIKAGFLRAVQAAGMDRDALSWLEGRWVAGYERWRNMSHAPEEIHALLEYVAGDNDMDAVHRQIIEAAALWIEEEKIRMHLVDFDDLIHGSVKLLSEHPDVAETLSRQYEFVSVDEAQDTDRAQYRMIQLLGKIAGGNIALVGDDDQAIYEWRGAFPANMQAFVDDFRPKIVRLEQNFRSASNIVSAASRHVAKNRKRLDKEPFSRIDGGIVHGFEFRDGPEMCAQIASFVRWDVLKRDVKLEDVAVMCRTKALLREIEVAFVDAGLEYHTVGALSVWDRIEGKFLLSLARTRANPSDWLAMRYILSRVEGLGDVALENIESLVTPWVMNNPDAGLSELASYLRDVAKKSSGRESSALFKAASALRYISDASGIVAPFRAAFEDGADERLGFRFALDKERAGKFLELGYWLERSSGEEVVWDVLLEHALRDADPQDEGGGVTLTTIHQAKGLEWRHVHIAGYSDGLIPLAGGDLEEERRLSYVALTRAAEMVTVYHARRMMRAGKWEDMEPSPFLREIGVKLVSFDASATGGKKAAQKRKSPGKYDSIGAGIKAGFGK